MATYHDCLFFADSRSSLAKLKVSVYLAGYRTL